MPSPQLLAKIFRIVKPAYLEEGRLDETDQVLHASFLLRSIRPAQLHPHPHLQRGVGKDRIPFRHFPIFPPLQGDRLRPIEDALQRSSTPAGQMLGQGSYQTLDRFIRDQTDAHETRVLQARGEKMDALAGAIDELHFDLSKIMLTELPGQTFETNQRLGRLRAERGHQRVEGSLASLIACFPNSPQNLQRR